MIPINIPEEKMQNKQSKLEKINTTFIYLTSFTAGFVILSLEILGFRLFAPFFGSSVYVSGSLITMVLTALSGGYYLGGKLADKHSSLNFLFRWIIFATLYLSIITIVYSAILQFFATFSPVMGTITATIIVFAFPMIMLSMVPPFLVKTLLQNTERANPDKKEVSIQHAGTIVGIISATSTIGSIAGSLATTFILIPWLGTKNTFLFCDCLLFVIAIIYFISQKKKYQSILILPIVLLSSFAFSKEKSSALYQKESIYNLIKVTEKGGYYFLHLNGNENIQSIYNAKKIFTKTYYDMFNVGPVIAEGKDVLILGLGGGTSANQLYLLFKANVEGVEIDPEVVKAAEKYFSIKEINPDIKTHVMDGREFLNKTNKKYDVIEIDMFHGGMYMPFHIATVEFFELVKKHLKDNGVMLINVLSFNEIGGGDILYYFLGNTIAKDFTSVFSIKQKQYNITIIAVNGQLVLSDVKERIRQNALFDREGIGEILKYAMENVAAYEHNNSYGFFTDDRAPIESVTYSMLKNVH